MKCPHCGNEINVGALIGAEGGKARSRAKTRAARANAKLGGWPKGKKRGKRKPDANQIAHSVVARAEKITRQGQSPRRLKVLPSPKSPKRGH
jgi:hypothetical protein